MVSPAPPPPAPVIRRRSLGRMVVGGTMLLLCTIATLIVALALLILFHHNLNATKGYKLRSLDRVRTQLLLQQETLNMDIAKAQALATLQADSMIQAMVKPTRLTYAKPDESVAVRVERGTESN